MAVGCSAGKVACLAEPDVFPTEAVWDEAFSPEEAWEEEASDALVTAAVVGVAVGGTVVGVAVGGGAVGVGVGGAVVEVTVGVGVAGASVGSGVAVAGGVVVGGGGSVVVGCAAGAPPNTLQAVSPALAMRHTTMAHRTLCRRMSVIATSFESGALFRYVI
jgi:hypothetical protein